MFSKGDAVIVQGRLTTNEYEKDGVLRSDLEMRASAIGPDLTRMSVSGLARRTSPLSVVPDHDSEAGADAAVTEGDSDDDGQVTDAPAGVAGAALATSAPARSEQVAPF